MDPLDKLAADSLKQKPKKDFKSQFLPSKEQLLDELYQEASLTLFKTKKLGKGNGKGVS